MDTDKKSVADKSQDVQPKQQKEQDKAPDNKTGLTGKLQGGRESLDVK